MAPRGGSRRPPTPPDAPHDGGSQRAPPGPRLQARRPIMKSLATLSIVLWIAMWASFVFDSPLGYVIAILGFAASVAVVLQLPAPRPSRRGGRSVVPARQ